MTSTFSSQAPRTHHTLLPRY